LLLADTSRVFSVKLQGCVCNFLFLSSLSIIVPTDTINAGFLGPVPFKKKRDKSNWFVCLAEQTTEATKGARTKQKLREKQENKTKFKRQEEKIN
jgi:hypothetical protein